MDDDNSWLGAIGKVPLSEAVPFGAGTTPQGSPTMLSNMVKALLTRPQRAIDASAVDMQNLGDHSVDKATVAPAVEQSLGLMGGGMSRAAPGTAGIFGGKLAQGADLRALEEAKLMAAGGKLPGQVRNDTGWFRTPSDYQWKFEIPDNKSALKYMPTRDNARAMGSVDSLMSHPDLFKNYPDLRNLKMDLTKSMHPDAAQGLGQFTGGNTVNVIAPNMPVGRSVALHELQHAVQQKEGFSYGSEPGWFAGQIEKGQRTSPEAGPYDFQKIQDLAHDLYHRTSGEVEARNVQTRADFHSGRRQNSHPWQTQDVPFIDQMHVDPITFAVTALRDKR